MGKNENRDFWVMGMYRNGLTYQEIADALDMKRNQVAGVVFRKRTSEDPKRRAGRRTK